MAYLKQRMFVESGVTPSQLDDEDYFELLSVMGAKPKDKRAVDPAEAFNMLRGISGKGGK